MIPSPEPDKPPSREEAAALLKAIRPGSDLIAIRPLPGSYSNLTHLIQARDPHGTDIRLVVRRYVEFGDYDRAEKARREFEIFSLLLDYGIPGPEPLYLDNTGEILGTPEIVTSYVPGDQIIKPSDPDGWARSLAKVLGEIHALPCESGRINHLLDANKEASWFLHNGEIPDYMKVDPYGVGVWEVTNQRMPEIAPVEPSLVHLDYWPGNILWSGDQIVAVLDWEEAARGDPAIDVAYFRMGLVMDGMDRAAEMFLRYYEMETGKRVANLGFWELCAAARPMFAPDVYELDDPGKRQRFDRFIENAMERVREGWH